MKKLCFYSDGYSMMVPLTPEMVNGFAGEDHPGITELLRPQWAKLRKQYAEGELRERISQVAYDEYRYVEIEVSSKPNGGKAITFSADCPPVGKSSPYIHICEKWARFLGVRSKTKLYAKLVAVYDVDDGGYE